MENNINKNPWKGLSSYTYQDSDCFYGRDQELKDIVSVIKQNAFTTLYGISGAGKTSIINAGLFPILDEQAFLPIYIRLDHNVGHVPYDIQIIKAVDKALMSINAERENIVEHDVESELDKLWLYFYSHRFWSEDNHIINPIIFIDQFEEIFTKNEDSENIWSFFNIIDSLQYSTPTERILKAMENTDQFVSFSEEQNFRMVFSMREDFLARLEDYSYNIPALRKNRIGLKPLNGIQALEVILKPRPDIVTQKAALHIISKIVGKTITDNERRLETTYIDTSILSLFCTELYNYAMQDNNGEISIPLIDLYSGNILEWFYDRNMQTLPKQTYHYIENQLLTHSGFRNSVALEDLLENGVLQEQLDLLAENRIIRIEDINHSLRVEFTHDVLCKIAKNRREERDKTEKMKNEMAARRAFTIDNVILFSTFIFGLMVFYHDYNGFDTSIIVFLFSIPFMVFLYMVIAHRTVADRNLSNTIGFIIICVMIEGYLITQSSSNPSLIDMACILFFPLAITLMPFAILVRSALQNRLQIFKSIKYSIITYTLFLITQSILLGYCLFYDLKDYILYFFIPSIVLALSPIYELWQNIRKKESKLLSGSTITYSLYIAIFFSIIYIQNRYSIFRSKIYDDITNPRSIIFIWTIISLLCAFYAIQYVKQPKQQSYTDYYRHVLGFQSFKKYKSFKYRLHTIIICSTIFMMGCMATMYIDILPFFTLPVACVLALHVGCSEFKLTTSKTAFSYKIIIPITILAEIIVGCQYIIGKIKIYAILISTLLIVALTLRHLIHKEIIRNQKLFVLRILAFSIFVGFLLPIICLGYNIFNPSLASVSRVWNGTISSNIPNIYFMMIKNKKEETGVMDYSEIIITPHYHKQISKSSLIQEEIAESVYPIRFFFIKNILNWHIIKDYRHVTNNNNEESTDPKIVVFYIKENDSIYTPINEINTLRLKTKYGKAFVKRWLSWPSERFAFKILSIKNACISDEDRNVAITRLFIKELSYYYNDYDLMDLNQQDSKYSINHDITLESLLRHYSNLTIEHIYMASINAGYLYASDKTGQLKNIVLGQLWDKLPKDSISDYIIENRAYLYLLAGDKEIAEKTAISSVQEHPKSINALCNLYISLYCNGKISELDEKLTKFYSSDSCMSDNKESFDEIMTSKLDELEELEVLKDRKEFTSHLASILGIVTKEPK